MRRSLVLLVAMTVALGGMAVLLAPAPEAAARTRLVRKSYAVSVACSPPRQDGWCPETYRRTVTTRGVLRVAFVADAAHCTPIEIMIWTFFDGGDDEIRQGFVLDPGESTGGVEFRSVRGPRLIEVWARDAPGGACADGNLAGWSGTLKVTTSQRVRR